MDKTIGVPETIKLLGITPTTLYSWLKKGKMIPPHHINKFGGYRWLLKDIKQFKKDHFLGE